MLRRARVGVGEGPGQSRRTCLRRQLTGVWARERLGGSLQQRAGAVESLVVLAEERWRAGLQRSRQLLRDAALQQKQRGKPEPEPNGSEGLGLSRIRVRVCYC